MNLVCANGIIQGTVTDLPTFSPLTNYTREQSIITFNNNKRDELKNPDTRYYPDAGCTAKAIETMLSKCRKENDSE